MIGENGGWNNLYFALRSHGEAVAYLKHAVLGARYIECCQAIRGHLEAGPSLSTVLGSVVDVIKFHQSLTTFYLAAATVSMLVRMRCSLVAHSHCWQPSSMACCQEHAACQPQ
jgi:uncharacterized protein (DUF1810 family)